MIFVAFLINEDPTSHRDVQEIVALGNSRAEAVGLVIDAWHDHARHHRLDPDSATEEDVAVVQGTLGDVWVNGGKL